MVAVVRVWVTFDTNGWIAVLGLPLRILVIRLNRLLRLL